MTDAQRLKHIRTELSLTQSEMASTMGYGSQQYVSLIENGQRNMSGVARKCLALISEKHGIETEQAVQSQRV